MITVQNDRIRVTVSDDVAAEYSERSIYLAHIQGTQTPEQIQRGLVLSDAMSILGNSSEVTILESEPITEHEIEDRVIELLTIQHLIEHCRYNVGETLMRMNDGHRMSLGMEADVEAARSWAHNKLRTNRSESMEIGKKSIIDERDRNLRYRQAKSNRDGFQIEIIGPMPSEIGLCRYQEA